MSSLDAHARAVLRGDEHGVEADRHAVLVLDRHLGLAVGAEEVDDALSLRTCASRSAMRCASQIGIGISASVSSHA